jgi:cytoskeleton protein RodZ
MNDNDKPRAGEGDARDENDGAMKPGFGENTPAHPEFTDEPEYGESPGQMLQRGRERQRVSLDDLVAQTKLSHSVLEAMEADDYDRLAEPVFVRGYYRRCARILGIPEAALLEVFEYLSGQPRPRPVATGAAGEGEAFHGSRGWLPLLLLVVFGCLLVAAIIWWQGLRTGEPVSDSGAAHLAGSQRHASVEDPSRNSETTVTDSMGQTPAGAARVSPGEEAVANVSAPEGMGSRESSPGGEPARAVARYDGAASSAAPREPASTAKPGEQADSGQGAASAGAEKPTPGAAALGKLHLSFSHKSWVSIKDASGKHLIYGTVDAGEARDVKGKPPYRIVLGYAPGVSMKFNGQSVDVAKRTGGKVVAHLTLGTP